METLRGLVARERRSERPALRSTGERERTYDYRRLLTDAWKTGNLLSHRGVRRGRTVGIVGATPEGILAFLGTASLGGVVHFDPPTDVDVRALVAPVGRVREYDLPPGGQRIAYGGPPEDATTAHFERDVWSENPTLAPGEIPPTDVVLVTDGRSFTHADLLAGAESVIERYGIEPTDEVALRTSLAVPGALVAGVVAPLFAGATMLLPADDAVGDIAVTSSETASVPEERVIDATAVL